MSCIEIFQQRQDFVEVAHEIMPAHDRNGKEDLEDTPAPRTWAIDFSKCRTGAFPRDASLCATGGNNVYVPTPLGPRTARLSYEAEEPAITLRLGNDAGMSVRRLDAFGRWHGRRLTFDMSGGWKRAQPAGNRPLDGGVRPSAR